MIPKKYLLKYFISFLYLVGAIVAIIIMLAIVGISNLESPESLMVLCILVPILLTTIISMWINKNEDIKREIENEK